jgi:TatD DNase family protein
LKLHHPPLFDTHAHIYSPAFNKAEQLQIIERALSSSLLGMVNIAASPSALHESLALASAIPETWTLKIAACTTPHEAQANKDPFFEEVQEAAEKGLLCAIGETGLDYHYHSATKELQMAYFEQYAQLAAKTHLPLIIHSRDAFSDVFALLKEYRKSLIPIIHCFTGNLDEALAYCDLGCYISISGIITFPKATALQQAITHIPLDLLLIETDSPYLAPEPHRGARNEPSFLPYIAKKVAQLRNLPLEVIAKATTDNALRLFCPS